MRYSRGFRNLLRLARTKRAIIVISLVLAIIETSALITVFDTEPQSFDAPPQFTFSDKVIYVSPIRIGTNGPSYFHSVARVNACFSSPYAAAFKTFEVDMSLDNATWTRVPLLGPQSDCHIESSTLGLVDLSKLTVVIYVRYYIPPQTVQLPTGVTKEVFLKSVNGTIMIHREASPKDQVATFLVCVALLGLNLAVANHISPSRGKTGTDLNDGSPGYIKISCL